MNMKTVRIQLEPLSAVMEVPYGAPLSHCLAQHSFEFPCGGNAVCGSCGVRVLSGSLPITDTDRTIYSASELEQGWRLACQAHATSPLVLECSQWRMDVLTGNAGLADTVKPITGRTGLGIAIDLGTTTVAAQLIDLATGSIVGVETGLNPQAVHGSDVMNRIRASLAGHDLTAMVRTALGNMVVKLAGGRIAQVAEIVLVGNTVMHHLFSGLDVEPLAHAPFDSPHLGEQHFSPQDLDWPLSPTCRIRFLRCLGGFVGSDILAGIVAVGMASSDALMALVDLGTNGEIVIGNREGIVCASTAAGPAFEAGAIHMGMRAVTGAISRVWLDDGALQATVIGNVPPRGICGSGLVDAVTCGLQTGAILPSGRIANGTKLFTVQNPVILMQADIRELQLAKGAIASGFRLLLRHWNAGADDLQCTHLAGAFGNYVQIDSAIAIGLLETPRERIHAVGNSALHGAGLLLLATEPSLPHIQHISLAADSGFQDQFALAMSFPDAKQKSSNTTTYAIERGSCSPIKYA
jgi:uncharacterized 2Fe-2S/4Fe-4S cluster protein (DUF4445 family)